MPHCSTHVLSAFALASSLLGPVIAQQSQRNAVAELAMPARRAHGIAVLKQAGAQALPALRAMLAWVGSTHEPEADAVMAALFVVHRLGKRAVDAIPELRRVYALSSDPRLRNQAMWTLASLAAATSDADIIAATQDNLRRDYTRDLDNDLVTLANLRLFLSSARGANRVPEFLRGSGNYVTAAAVAAADLPTQEADLDSLLRDDLELALTRPAEPWAKDWRCDDATGYLARALQIRGEIDNNIARGLLLHWDPEVRGLGLAALTDTSKLTAYERIDIVMRLWDSDRSVCEQALASLLAQGVHGIVGLRAMRAFERDPTTGARAIVFRRAADSLVATCCSLTTPAGAALLRAADRILRGDQDVAPSQPADAAGANLLAELVVGCRGADDGSLPQLARLAHDSKALQSEAGGTLAVAFVSCFAISSELAWNQTALALAELGPAAIQHLPDAAATILCSRLAYGHGCDNARVFITEAAIRVGKCATDGELRTALASPRWHLALMATAELVRRGVATRLDAPRLRLLATANYEDVTLAAPNTSSTMTAWPSSPMLMLAMAAVSLTQVGEDPWSLPGATEAVAREFEVPADQVPILLLSARNAGTLPDLALRIVRDACAEFSIFLPK